MNIVLAFDSFKGSLTAAEAVDAVARGVHRYMPDSQLVRAPIADGGEGTVEILTAALGGVQRSTRVHGPLQDPVEATWGWVASTRTALIEMAAAAGLGLVPLEQRDPTRNTTYGVGELIRAALDAGADRIILGIGGSATVDGGTGMAEALGVRFDGCDHPMTGGQLSRIESIDLSRLDPRLRATTLEVALDVGNPLLGPRGAAAVFGPQKGATPSQVRMLDDGLGHLAALLPAVSPETRGAGAAGGLGWGLSAFCGAELRSGIDLCLDAIGFDGLLEGADLVLTGEGMFDRQSLEGKAPIGVAARARAPGIPVVVLSGDHSVPASICRKNGILACYSIRKNLGASQEQAMANAAILLETLASRILPELIESITVGRR